MQPSFPLPATNKQRTLLSTDRKTNKTAEDKSRSIMVHWPRQRVATWPNVGRVSHGSVVSGSILPCDAPTAEFPAQALLSGTGSVQWRCPTKHETVINIGRKETNERESQLKRPQPEGTAADKVYNWRCEKIDLNRADKHWNNAHSDGANTDPSRRVNFHSWGTTEHSLSGSTLSNEWNSASELKTSHVSRKLIWRTPENQAND